MKALFTTLVLVYLALDFGDPNLPGATTFDPDDSVEVVHLQRDPSPAPPAPAVTPERFLRTTTARVTVLSLTRRTRVAPPPPHVSRRLAPDPSVPEEG